MNASKNESVEALKKKLAELSDKIESWGHYNSQSNPGAVMDLRDMKRRHAAILQELKKVQDAEHPAPE